MCLYTAFLLIAAATAAPRPLTPPPGAVANFCGAPACTETVWRTMATDAGGATFSCGGRIEWLQSSSAGSSQLGEEAACRQIAAKEFPAQCGGCDPGPPASPLFRDDFDGASLDRVKWNVEINCGGGNNGEAQCYVDDPQSLFLRDGYLHIVARRDAAGKV